VRTPIIVVSLAALFIWTGLVLAQQPVTPAIVAVVDDADGVAGHPFHPADSGDQDGKPYMLTQIVRADAYRGWVPADVDPFTEGGNAALRVLSGVQTTGSPIAAGRIYITFTELAHEQNPASPTSMARDPDDRLESLWRSSTQTLHYDITDGNLAVFPNQSGTNRTYRHPFLRNATDVSSPLHAWLQQFSQGYIAQQTAHPDPQHQGQSLIPSPDWFILDCESAIFEMVDRNSIGMLEWLAHDQHPSPDPNFATTGTWTGLRVPGYDPPKTLADLYAEAAVYYGFPTAANGHPLGILDPVLGINSTFDGSDPRNRHYSRFWSEVCQRSRDSVLATARGVLRAAWPDHPPAVSNYDDGNYDGVVDKTGWYQDWPNPDDTGVAAHPEWRTVPNNMFPRALPYSNNNSLHWGSSYRPNGGADPVSSARWVAVREHASGDGHCPEQYRIGSTDWVYPTGGCGLYLNRQSNLLLPRATYEAGRCRWDTSTSNPLRDETILHSSTRKALLKAEADINSFPIGAEASGLHEDVFQPWLPMAYDPLHNDIPEPTERGALLSPDELRRFLPLVLRAKNARRGIFWTGNIQGDDAYSLYDYIWQMTINTVHAVYAVHVNKVTRVTGSIPTAPGYLPDWDGPLVPDGSGHWMIGPNGPIWALEFTLWARTPTPSPQGVTAGTVVYPTVDLMASSPAKPTTVLDVEMSVPAPYGGCNDYEITFQCSTTIVGAIGRVYAWDFASLAWRQVPVLIEEPSATDALATETSQELDYHFYTPADADGFKTTRRTAFINSHIAGAGQYVDLSGVMRLRFVHTYGQRTDFPVSRYDLVLAVPASACIPASGAASIGAPVPVAQSDVDYDQTLGTMDVIQFLTDYSQASPAADMNQDGVIDTSDVVSFITHYADGT
jgi:hypothetical protein